MCNKQVSRGKIKLFTNINIFPLISPLFLVFFPKEREREMGKQGPCYHCGVPNTPLWRNGPPEKPVLCNACGSRWRTKGTLANYTPLHARAEPGDYEVYKVRVRSISINKNKEVKPLKRKQYHDNVIGGVAPDYNQGFQKCTEEDTSNRSSSGSAVSNTESCAQFGSVDASDLTGPAQSVVWESEVPSRKRTCFNRPKVSSVEKLTKDLYTILHEQQSSCISVSSEEDLLFESEAPMLSVEIGHGSVLIRHPGSIARDEESEASSLSVDNKLHSIHEAYSHSAALPVYNGGNSVSFPSPVTEKYKNPTVQGMQQYQLKRDRPQHDKLQLLRNHNSPLQYIHLEDVLNFEEFLRHLTNEEQQQLLKYLPQVDTIDLPDSLICMFDSPQFKENISSFRQLLVEGVFDSTLSGVKTEDCKTLKRFTLSNLTKCQWVEHYHLLKTCKQPVAGRNAIASNHLVNQKKSGDCQNQKFSEASTIVQKSKKVSTKASYENKEPVDSDSSCFSPRSLFALPPDGNSLMLDSFQFVGESSDQDLLLDVPSNNSFPQAELLHQSFTYGTQQASTSSSTMYPRLARP